MSRKESKLFKKSSEKTATLANISNMVRYKSTKIKRNPHKNQTNLKNSKQTINPKSSKQIRFKNFDSDFNISRKFLQTIPIVISPDRKANTHVEERISPIKSLHTCTRIKKKANMENSKSVVIDSSKSKSTQESKNNEKPIITIQPVTQIHLPNKLKLGKNTKTNNKPKIANKSTTISAKLSKELEEMMQSSDSNLQISFETFTKECPQKKYCKIYLEVKEAVAKHKIFMICAHNQAIACINSGSIVRTILTKQGWIEKIVSSSVLCEFKPSFRNINVSKLSVKDLIQNMVSDSINKHIYLRILKSKLLGNYVCDFFWNPKPITFDLIAHEQKPIFVNVLRDRGKFDFCTKIGLNNYLRLIPENPNIHFPRTYIMSKNEFNIFINDYRITACISLIKWAVCRINSKQILVSKSGRVPMNVLTFAILQCLGFIRYSKDMRFSLYYSAHTWDQFDSNYRLCINHGEHFCNTSHEDIDDLYAQMTRILQCLDSIVPRLNLDGYFNLWIIKPNMQSRGRGISICKTMSEIRDRLFQNNSSQQSDYLIQKYIEKPLLIYNTKFDIRQWFLISSTSPFILWMYTECYLRFSSQTYDLTRTNESIHLTNNAIQCRYKSSVTRDSNLPNDNMWDSYQFQNYLKKIKHPHAWNMIIYPRMKETILSVMLCAKTDMEKRPNSFELYGADFILTNDYQPCLLEINSDPAMDPSTVTTSGMCPEVLENVVNLILKNTEYMRTKNKFELIYSEDLIL